MEDLRLAASYMSGAKRRAFQAEITLKYCNGSARVAESQFGWSRRAVSIGLGEKRTGVTCQGAQSALSGNKRWEARQPLNNTGTAQNFSTYQRCWFGHKACVGKGLTRPSH